MRAIAGSGYSIAHTDELKASLRYDTLGRLHEVEKYIQGVAQGPRRFRNDGDALIGELVRPQGGPGIRVVVGRW